MGTTVSSLHILNAAEPVVHAALSKREQNTAVFYSAGRFLTVCLGENLFDPLNRKAKALSKKLDQPVLAVSMFDGDDLDLSLFQNGCRLTRHVVNLEAETSIAGNAKVFCGALGLSEDMAPKLKRLLADPDQEEKLSILSALLGAPLFARWDTPESFRPVPPDAEPLERWLSDHPLPPKLKNRCHGEMVQEVLDMALDYEGAPAFIFRPLAYADAAIPGQTINCGGYIYQEKSSDGRPVEGYYCSGGFWGRLGSDGKLELTPLREEGLQRSLEGECPGGLNYAELDGRLVTCGQKMAGMNGGWSPAQTVVLADTAGILPLPLPVEVEGRPRVAMNGIRLLPDGGFSADLTACYRQSAPFVPPVLEAPAVRAIFGPDGSLRSTEAIGEPVSAFSDHTQILGGTAYCYQLLGHRRDALLRRLSDGAEAGIPCYSTFALSPDGARLFAAGFRSGLAVLDAASHRVLRRLERKDGFYLPLADRENRLWVGNGGYLECYDPDLELISRHRLAGELVRLWLAGDGAVIALTYQRKKFHTRVYRFTSLETKG